MNIELRNFECRSEGGVSDARFSGELFKVWAASEIFRSIRIVLTAGTLICDVSAPAAAKHNKTTRLTRTYDVLKLNGFIVAPFDYSEKSLLSRSCPTPSWQCTHRFSGASGWFINPECALWAAKLDGQTSRSSWQCRQMSFEKFSRTFLRIFSPSYSPPK